MNWTKLILALYPALLLASLHLTARGMADQGDPIPRPDEWLWLVGIAVVVPAIHLFVLRRVRYDRFAYRFAALVGAPIIIIPFIGLVVGVSVYGLLTYLLLSRGRRGGVSPDADANVA